MGNVLTFVEYQDGQLRGSALSAITAARKLAEAQGGQVVLLLAGKDAQSAAAHASTFAPKTVVVEDAGLEHYLAETYAPVVAEVAKAQGATALVACANNVGKDLFPRVAALLDGGLASDISGVVAKNQFRRPILAGNAIATVEVSSPIVLVTARQAEFAPAPPLGGAGEVQSAPAGTLDARGAKFVGVSVSKSERPELAEAKVVVSGGRGMKNGENFKVLEALADQLGAAVGASRAATDAGFVPADLQVGQTGKVVAPNLYIAVAISGAIQHLAGMKGSKVIVAINKDPEAPIFQVADYGLIGNWEKVIPELTEAVKAHKAKGK
jgi:electron transfer flavoprotein alpha subunit